ncbi:oxidoreductase [Winogradskyella aurantia]|uniref:Oxidoreductase n=1 Tax=Winogradskyella aurantia TaxID=1915063 RepID=A0A265UWT0_9FLAO|nr:oxidoreductase [Winogradskyella aurantia]
MAQPIWLYFGYCNSSCASAYVFQIVLILSAKTINWGIIGAGRIAAKFAEDLNSVSNCQLLAIASRDLEKAKQFALTHKAQKAYGSYEALVDDSGIDAIYIATPHSFHKPHSLLALAQHKAVLCEKPFAMNLEEVDAMIEGSKANNTLLMEAMWTMFLPHFQYVLNLVKNGHFGKVLKLEADFGFNPEYDETSRVFKKSLGGGSLLDIGIYPVFAALSTLGVPKSITAEATYFPNGTDATCTMEFNYDDAQAILKSTFLEETKTEAIFHCERGLIKMNGRFHQPTTVTLISGNGDYKTKDFNCTRFGYNYEIEHFNTLLRQGKTESPIMPFETSRQLIHILDKVRAKIGLDYT